MSVFYGKNKDAYLATVRDNFVPVVVDSYRLGNSADIEFASLFVRVNNQPSFATASGKPLGIGWHDIGKAYDEFYKLPEEERRPKVETPETITHEKSPTPPPAGCLIARVYIGNLERDSKGNLYRVRSYAFPSGTRSTVPLTETETIWITEQEWKALVPANPRELDRVPVPASLQRRMFRYYSPGPCKELSSFEHRSGELTATVEGVSTAGVRLRLEGYAQTGAAFDPNDATKHGCDLRFLGFLNYNARKKAFDRFDIVAIGERWGDSICGHRDGAHGRWPIGIAYELASSERAIDRVTPGWANDYAGTLDDYFSGTSR